MDRRPEPFTKNPSPSLNPLLHHLQQAPLDTAHLRARQSAQRSLERQAWRDHAPPTTPDTPRRVDAPGGSTPASTIRSSATPSNWNGLRPLLPAIAGLPRHLRIAGNRERRAEQPRLGPGEPQIGGADRAQAGAREVGGSPRRSRASSFSIATASADERRRPHRLQQRVAAGEVPVRGIGNHACAARGLAQHHRIGPAVARQRDARIQQRLPQIAMTVGAASAMRGRPWHPSSPLREHVDTVHRLCYLRVDGVYIARGSAHTKARRSRHAGPALSVLRRSLRGGDRVLPQDARRRGGDADALEGQSRTLPGGHDPARHREQGDACGHADRRRDGDGLRRTLHRGAELPGIFAVARRDRRRARRSGCSMR